MMIWKRKGAWVTNEGFSRNEIITNTTPHIAWEYDPFSSNRGSIMNSPCIDEHGSSYFTDNDGIFHSVDHKGEPNWIFKPDNLIKSNESPKSSCTVVDHMIGDTDVQTVYFGSGTHIYCLDRHRGSQLFDSIDTGSVITDTPIVRNHVHPSYSNRTTMYVHSGTELLAYWVDYEDGPKFRSSKHVASGSPGLSSSGYGFMSYITLMDNELLSIDPHNFDTTHFSVKFDQSLYASPISLFPTGHPYLMGPPHVLVTTEQGCLHTFYMHNLEPGWPIGELYWTRCLNSQILSTPCVQTYYRGEVIGSDWIAVATVDGHVHFLDPNDGSTIWSHYLGDDTRVIAPLVAHTDDNVYAVTSKGDIVSLSVMDRKELWRFEFDRYEDDGNDDEVWMNSALTSTGILYGTTKLTFVSWHNSESTIGLE